MNEIPLVVARPPDRPPLHHGWHGGDAVKILVKLDHKGENQKYLKPPAKSICIFDSSTPGPLSIFAFHACDPING